VYGPFVKREGTVGPQEKMHYRYDELKNINLRFVAEDINQSAIKRYWLMTGRALQAIIEQNKEDKRNNCFYEIMPSPQCTYKCTSTACKNKLSAFGTRAYLDLEFPFPCDFENFETSACDPLEIGSKIAKCFGNYLQDTLDCRAECILLKSHRPGKYSWHAIFKTYRGDRPIYFRNSLSLLTVMIAFFNAGLASPYVYFEAGKEGEEMQEKNIIDESVYSTHKLIRTYQSQKFGRLTGSFVLDSGPLKNFQDALVLQKLSKDSLFFDVQDADSTTKILQNKVGEKRKLKDGQSAVAKVPRKLKVDLEASKILDIYSKLSVWKKTLEFIVKEFPTFERNKVQAKSFDRIYIPLDHDRRCPFKRGSGPDGAHKNNHSCLMLYPQKGALYWRCQKRECRDKGASVYLHLPMDVKMAWKILFSHKCVIGCRPSS
tara:strand:- start:3815 stop:5104 length:1290 start_codon:yes stop_codon:yes gene_type:complete